MMKGRGGRLQRGLADMTSRPKDRPYRPPVGGRSDDTYPIVLDWDESNDNQLTVRYRTYRKMIVDFAVIQMTMITSTPAEVARIDCCGGTIHWHLWNKYGDTLRDHEKILDIPYGERGQVVVNESFTQAIAMMQDEWERNLRRWNDYGP